MQARRDQILTQPALVPIAGNFDRKPRSLDRDVTTVGRARGTDLCLEANEISTLHCVLYRTADGYRVRDCNSRCGTRVNGESVKSQTLHDGDIVNLGPFSFEFHVPPALFPKDGVKLDPLKVEHWKNSRKRLAKLALRLRKRGSGGSPREQESAQKVHLLKEKIRSYDQRLGELEDAENELSQERDLLAKETEEHRQRVQHLEGDLAQRLEQAEKEIHQKWQEFQKRCQGEEARVLLTQGKVTDPHAVEAVLAQLRREVDAERIRLRDLEEYLARQQDLLQREQQEFTTMKEQWVKAQTKSSEALEEQQAALALQEAGVRAQKAELMRMMGDLKKMQDDLRKQPRADLSALQAELDRANQENAALRGVVEKLGQTAGSVSDDEVLRQVNELRAELDLLNEELLNKEQMLADLQNKPSNDGAFEQIRAENLMLKTLLEEKTKFVAEQPAPAPKTENDLERYETELNEFRRQLENDRGKLNQEVEMLRERNKELDEAIREMEMEMSKERAELARERMRLERVREEVKGDTERLQRELAVRDSMAPVQKLRDELAQKHGTPAKGEKPLNDRLRSIRGQLTDSSPAAGS
jgi:pSer/pThr/pTyr-binding forkhead associated (FHA) protein